MTNFHPNLFEISKITDNIYLSGIYPFDADPELIKSLGIKYVLSCVDRSLISEIHDKVLFLDSGIQILYVPYDDILKQNLWKTNNRTVDLIKYSGSVRDHELVNELLLKYDGKPMIDIAYHFIDKAVKTNSKIIVHCMAGVSRSSSMIIYYFMKKYGISYDEAYYIIKDKRKIVNPNKSFKQQLIGYQDRRVKFIESEANRIISNIIECLPSYEYKWDI